MNHSILARLEMMGGAAMSTFETLLHSYFRAKSVLEQKVPGVFVECGVFAGSQCGAMALAILEAGDGRKIHCFDSFCGFPKASPEDGAAWQQRLGVGPENEPSKPLEPAWGFNAPSSDQVRENFRKWGLPLEMFVFHEGWFCDTMRDWRQWIALLRIDGDLHDSVATCLQQLYPWLERRGVCILDDYGLSGGRKAYEKYFRDQEVVLNGPVWWTKE